MTACRTDTPQPPPLRLVTANPHAARRLMPLRELERRLSAIDRGLACRCGPPERRADLRRQRELVAAILAVRLSMPERARRLEQRLRWLAPWPDAPAPTRATGMGARMRAGMRGGMQAALRALTPVTGPARMAGA